MARKAGIKTGDWSDHPVILAGSPVETL
jgi:hypothetical protein